MDFSSQAFCLWGVFPPPTDPDYGGDYLVTAVEFIGDTTATAMVCEDRLPTQRELRGGILCDALSSVLSGVFNFAPNISYSDGVGIIGSTRVASRTVMMTSGVLITLAGLVPKFSALLYTMPLLSWEVHAFS